MNFFQCAFDASVTGLDVVATCARGWDNGQSTNFSASLNINNPVVEGVKKFVDATGTTRTFFDGECIYDFKHAKPHWRSVPTARRPSYPSPKRPCCPGCEPLKTPPPARGSRSTS